MKKILIPLCVFFALVLAAGVYFFSAHFENVSDRTEIAKYLAQAIERDSLSVTMDGQTVKLGAKHSASLLDALTWGRMVRTRDWAEPDHYTDKIVLHMGDLAVTVYELDTTPQADVIEKDIGGQKRWARLEKFSVVQRLKTIVGQ